MARKQHPVAQAANYSPYSFAAAATLAMATIPSLKSGVNYSCDQIRDAARLQWDKLGLDVQLNDVWPTIAGMTMALFNQVGPDAFSLKSDDEIAAITDGHVRLNAKLEAAFKQFTPDQRADTRNQPVDEAVEGDGEPYAGSDDGDDRGFQLFMQSLLAGDDAATTAVARSRRETEELPF